ncbi:MAG: hypothetical protein RBT69_05050 [Spirochaetia bacterium]|nr:hypothetical protein [Spirochaetia bacterium]
MDINFYKIHVLKNDFILSDSRKTNLINNSLLSKTAVSICDRHTGVGAKGIIYIISADLDEIVIKTYSPDGRLYSSVLDSTLIATRYIFDTISINTKIIKIVNNDIPLSVQIIDSTSFRISVGAPSFNTNLTENLVIGNYTYTYTKIDLGRNSLVFFPENKSNRELKELSSNIIKSSAYSDSLPVFVFPAARNSINVRHWLQTKRLDNLLVCSIASVAASLNGYDNENLVMLQNNAAYVEWDRENNQVYVTSSPEYIFTGSYYFEENRD